MSFLKNFLMKRQLIGSKSFGLAGMRRLATATPSTSAATANAQKAAEKAKQSATAAVGRLSGKNLRLITLGLCIKKTWRGYNSIE